MSKVSKPQLQNREFQKLTCLFVIALALTASDPKAASGAEGATGFCALGTKASMAGFVPPPGTYFIDVNYFYSGDASASSAVGVALRDIGNLTLEADVKVDAEVYYNLPSVLWVAPAKILGAMSVSVRSFP